jgi:hypothetical protein
MNKKSKDNIATTNLGPTNFRFRVIAGGSAGNLACTGVKANDKIEFVVSETINTNGAVGTNADLTSEFKVYAANTIDNTSGTTTANKRVYVGWRDMTTP